MSQYLGLSSHRSPPPPPQQAQHHEHHQHHASQPPPFDDPSPQSHELRPLRRRLPFTALPSPLIIYPDSPSDPPPPINQTMLQGFEWYIPADHTHWRRLSQIIPSVAHLGVTSLWIPPACKASWRTGNGYDIYDLYDLGEFEQKGSRETKWGGKEELVRLGEVAGEHGVRVLFDAVLNHKAAADYSERARAVRVDPRDRNRAFEGSKEEDGEVEGERGDKVEEIESWTGWNFPGRGGKYSPMRWNKEHFTGIDYDHLKRENGVWRFEGKEWAGDVDEELGNYDYLMFADIDHKHPDVRRDIFYWTSWLSRQVKLGGMRVDAIKHYSFEFLRDLVTHIHDHVDPSWFIVGEYWRQDSEFLARYIEFMGHNISLFDVQLVHNISKLSLLEEKGDLRTVFDDALVVWKPDNAVSFVVNHDTQAGQSLETPVAPFFIPLAYALILLRANAGLPCVFYSDLYGSMKPHHDDRAKRPSSSSSSSSKNDTTHPSSTAPPKPAMIPPTSGGVVLPKMMLARKLWAYGTQIDYFDDPHCVGFTRAGHPGRSGGAGLAVVVTNGWAWKSKRMCVGRRHAGETWTDVLRWCPGRVVIDGEGWGEFFVGPRSVSVWVCESAEGREGVEEFVFDYDIYGFKSKAEEQKKARQAKVQSEHV